MEIVPVYDGTGAPAGFMRASMGKIMPGGNGPGRYDVVAYGTSIRSVPGQPLPSMTGFENKPRGALGANEYVKIAAGGESQKGDSGGGLYYEIDGKTHLAGILEGSPHFKEGDKLTTFGTGPSLRLIARFANDATTPEILFTRSANRYRLVDSSMARKIGN